MRAWWGVVAILLGCGQTNATSDAGDATIADSGNAIRWRLTPGFGSVRMVEVQNGILVSGFGTDWSAPRDANTNDYFTAMLTREGQTSWIRHVWLHEAAPSPSGWSIVGTGDQNADFLGWPPVADGSNFLSFMDFAGNAVAFRIFPAPEQFGTGMEGVARNGDWVWVRGVTGTNPVDLGGGPLDAGADGSSFVARYFGSTGFTSAQFFDARHLPTAIAATPSGVIGTWAEATAIHVFRITTASVYSELRSFSVSGGGQTYPSFRDLEPSGDGVVGVLSWPIMPVDFGLPSPGPGGTVIVKLDGSGAPQWSTSVGDPYDPICCNWPRRIRTLPGGDLAVLGVSNKHPALFRITADGQVTPQRWEATDEVVWDFAIDSDGTVVVGSLPYVASEGGAKALIEYVTSFP